MMTNVHATIYRPQIFHRRNDAAAFERHKRDAMITELIDSLPNDLKELSEIRDPAQPKDTDAEGYEGNWISYPWKHAAVRTLLQNDYALVRSSRNRNLITSEEAATLATKRIAIAGLNVGNPGLLCLVQESIGGSFRLADNDVLSLSNLNRFRAGLTDVGLNKAVLSARQAYEIDPYANIEVWADGVSKERLSAFLEQADLLIEEMDNLPLKILIREEAKKRGIPTIMVTGNGHDIILDIERFDKEPDLPLLSGKLRQNIIEAIFSGTPTKEERIKLARDFMGESFLCERLRESFLEVGKTLAGIPQLSEASFLRGAALAFAARMILSNEPRAISGRYVFGLSQLFASHTL